MPCGTVRGCQTVSSGQSFVTSTWEKKGGRKWVSRPVVRSLEKEGEVGAEALSEAERKGSNVRVRAGERQGREKKKDCTFADCDSGTVK